MNKLFKLFSSKEKKQPIAAAAVQRFYTFDVLTTYSFEMTVKAFTEAEAREEVRRMQPNAYISLVKERVL